MAISGVIVPTVTALTDEEVFDETGQRRLIKYLADNGVNAVFALGLTGEVDLLSNSTRRRVMEVTAETVDEIRTQGGTIEALLGVNGDTSEETLENINYANELPVSGIVVQPSKISIDINAFLEAVGGVSKLLIYLYANPATALDKKELLTPEIAQTISQNPKFSGLKVSDAFSELERYCRFSYANGFGLYFGNAIDIFRANGALLTRPRGVITGPGNAFPQIWKKAWESKDAQERERIKEFCEDFQRIYNGIPSGKNTIAAIKYILHLNEILDSPRCRAKNLTDGDKRYIEERYGLLSGK